MPEVERGGGGYGEGYVDVWDVLQTGDLALSISIIGGCFSDSLGCPGQWNIVNGLGALCYVPHCFSLQQCCDWAQCTNVIPAIAIHRGQAQHCIALHIAAVNRDIAH